MHQAKPALVRVLVQARSALESKRPKSLIHATTRKALHAISEAEASIGKHPPYGHPGQSSQSSALPSMKEEGVPESDSGQQPDATRGKTGLESSGAHGSSEDRSSRGAEFEHSRPEAIGLGKGERRSVKSKPPKASPRKARDLVQSLRAKLARLLESKHIPLYMVQSRDLRLIEKLHSSIIKLKMERSSTSLRDQERRAQRLLVLVGEMNQLLATIKAQVDARMGRPLKDLKRGLFSQGQVAKREGKRKRSGKERRLRTADDE